MKSFVFASLVAALVAGPVATLTAAEPTDAQLYEQAVAKGVQYLATQGQADDGSYSKQVGPAVTALVTSALLRNGRTVNDPDVAKALKYIEQFVHEDGAIHMEGSTHRNYETCLSMMCFAAANQDGRYTDTIAKAEKFVRGLQWGADGSIDKSNFNYGGAGYGRSKRPDLSNTQYFIEALRSTGAGEDDEALKKALIFVSRCQNLETEYNTSPFAAKNPDGGFYYTVAAGGSSQAGDTADGGLRSYGSMTYAGLKSMIYAGVGPDDPRVKAAMEWLGKHYDLESNPGMGTSGLYYYYNTFAKALDATGEDEFTDADGTKHNWRSELIRELAKRQQDNGSWINENERWLEGDPNLVTGYALLALSYAKPKPEKKAE